MRAKTYECLAYYASGDLLRSELEDEVKEWKKLRKGPTTDRNDFMSKLLAKLNELLDSQNKVGEPLQQEFLEVKAKFEQLVKEVGGV